MSALTLNDLTTKELHNALSRARPIDYGWRDENDNLPEKPVVVGARMITGGIRVEVSAKYSEIKAALAGRPHVPSKAEAKAARQARAKASR